MTNPPRGKKSSELTRAWVEPLFVGAEQAYVHRCGGIGLFPPSAAPSWSTLCPTCEQDFGGWRPALVEYTGGRRANTTVDEDHADLQVALREAPGSTSSELVYRWRHPATGATHDLLPARVDPRQYEREVAVVGRVHGHWRKVPDADA